jgi:hypothetical protein
MFFCSRPITYYEHLCVRFDDANTCLFSSVGVSLYAVRKQYSVLITICQLFCTSVPAGTSLVFLLILLFVRHLLPEIVNGGSGLGCHWTTPKCVEPVTMDTVTPHRKVACRGGALPVTIFGNACCLTEFCDILSEWYRGFGKLFSLKLSVLGMAF